ncbi:MAG: TfoX/Sxy family protein [Flavobacteriales bacterium]|nr:TfoX/Sxy family protein [Flavobacteriales bacterium]
MAHDPFLEQRLADALAGLGTKAEPKKMFGGVAFMIRGNMAVGITNKSLYMVRFAAARHAEIMKWPGALPMTYGKGDMKGFLFVDPDVVSDRRSLDKWVKLALEHVATLPTKALKKTATKKAAAKAPAKAAKKTAARKVKG